MKLIFSESEEALYGHKPGTEPSPEHKALYHFVDFVQKHGGTVEVARYSETLEGIEQRITEIMAGPETAEAHDELNRLEALYLGGRK